MIERRWTLDFVSQLTSIASEYTTFGKDFTVVIP